MYKNNGFTLIEVLIAMIILAVGLLGLAGLQATSLKNNQSAYNRSKATQLAYDMADRMRANITEARRTGNVYLATAAPTAVENCGNTTGCTQAEMAQNDRFEWSRALDSATNRSGGLPGGTGTITFRNNIYTITINWTENRDEDRNDSSNITRFEMSFQL